MNDASLPWNLIDNEVWSHELHGSILVPKTKWAQTSPFDPVLTSTTPSVPGHNADMLTDATSVDGWDIQPSPVDNAQPAQQLAPPPPRIVTPVNANLLEVKL